MKFLTKVVVFSLAACVIYTITEVIYQCATGVELSPALTDKFFTVFGTELGAAALIKIADTVCEKVRIRDKITVAKENGVEDIESLFDRLIGKDDYQ